MEGFEWVFRRGFFVEFDAEAGGGRGEEIACFVGHLDREEIGHDRVADESSFLDGVGPDAIELATHLAHHLDRTARPLTPATPPTGLAP